MTIENGPFRSFEVVNEAPDLYSIRGDELLIETSSGSMWGKGNTCGNLFLFPGHMNEAWVEVVVTLLPENNGEQAGLVIYRDADNYIKLVREMVNRQQVIVLAKEIQGHPEAILIKEVASAEVKLRMEVNRHGVAALWQAPNAVEERADRVDHWLGHGTDVKAGLLVHGRNNANKAKFSSFKYSGDQSHGKAMP